MECPSSGSLNNIFLLGLLSRRHVRAVYEDSSRVRCWARASTSDVASSSSVPNYLPGDMATVAGRARQVEIAQAMKNEHI